MGKTEAAAIIVGIVMPLLITLVKQFGWPAKVNFIIALVSCAGAGVLTAWAFGLFTGTAVIVAIATIFTVAQAEYRLFWQGTQTEELVNLKTSFVK